MSDPARVMRESLADPYGSISPSMYDTACLVALPARLRPAGQADFLLRNQNADGSWGSPAWAAAYRVVPSLAATAALLRLGAEGQGAAARGLAFLRAYPTTYDAETLPDTIAVEHLVPALVDTLLTQSANGARPLWLRDKVNPMDRDAWLGMRRAARAGASLPVHVDHCLEVLGDDLRYVDAVPAPDGGYGCSPAATAAVLARGAGERNGYIERAIDVAGGAPPTVLPIATTERAWIASYLLRARVPLPRAAIAHDLRARLGDAGATLGDGLPPDADNTAVILTVLADLGAPVDPDALFTFEGDEWFHTYYGGERRASVTVNAHVLEALMACARPRHERSIAKARDFVLSLQERDGHWAADKWHASPYYATACCVAALARAPAQWHAIERAIAWVLATQRDDGSWGAWTGTLEETAHAVAMLGSAAEAPEARTARRRGKGFLLANLDAPPGDPVRTPLWHGKELFEPSRIVRALVLGALL